MRDILAEYSLTASLEVAVDNILRDGGGGLVRPAALLARILKSY